MDTVDQAILERRIPWDLVEIRTREYVVYRVADDEQYILMNVLPMVADQSHVLKCLNYAVTMGIQNVESENNVVGYTVNMPIGSGSGQLIAYPYVSLILHRS